MTIGGDPRPPGGGRLSNDPMSFVDTAIHNIDLALDDPRTPEKARAALLKAQGYLVEASV